nr:Putative capsular polysaccharide transport protein YegH [Salmonella sp. NCTC 7297]
MTGENEQEDLLGVVHVIDLLQQSLRGEPLNLRALIRQPLVFPENIAAAACAGAVPVNARTHFAFVVDEFGSVEGIVTLSDVMETIAGNLPNEVEEIDARHDIQKNPDGSWTANGHMPLEDLVQYVPLPLDEKREYHTIAGLLMEYLQRIPKTGEEVQVGDYLLKTLQVESHRVQKVQLIPLHNGESDQEDVTPVRLPRPAYQVGRRRVNLAIRPFGQRATAYPAAFSHLYRCGFLYCAPPSH